MPLVGLVPEDNIREGTSYKYFATELVVFVGLSMAAPRQFLDTWTGRVLLAVHLPLHIGLVIGDYVAHEEVHESPNCNLSFFCNFVFACAGGQEGSVQEARGSAAVV